MMIREPPLRPGLDNADEMPEVRQLPRNRQWPPFWGLIFPGGNSDDPDQTDEEACSYIRPLNWDRRLATTSAKFPITFTPILGSL
jgi:hypothetical protein